MPRYEEQPGYDELIKQSLSVGKTRQPKADKEGSDGEATVSIRLAQLVQLNQTLRTA